MDFGALNAAYIRETYLRGIHLGAAWHGAQGDAAINRLIAQQEEIVHARLGVLFCRRRVLTVPDVGLTLDEDYEVAGVPFAYQAPPIDAVQYALTLPFPHVQSLQRLRLFEGYDTAPIPAPIFETMPLGQLMLSAIDGKVYFPVALVTNPTAAQAWVPDYTIGLGQIPAEIAEWIALQVAILVLSNAGSGTDVSGGIGSQSLTMDGITETKNVGTTDYGIYSGTIKAYKDRFDVIDISRFRMRYLGMRLP